MRHCQSHDDLSPCVPPSPSPHRCGASCYDVGGRGAVWSTQHLAEVRMTERDLENLKSLPVPQARSDAKRAALVAAMAAFENEHASSSLPAGAPLGVSEATTEETSSKGNIIPLRQTETSTLKRSFRMNFSSRSTQAIAASVAALVVAAPFAFQHLATLREAPTLTVAQTELKTAAGSSSAPASAPVARAKMMAYCVRAMARQTNWSPASKAAKRRRPRPSRQSL